MDLKTIEHKVRTTATTRTEPTSIKLSKKQGRSLAKASSTDKTDLLHFSKATTGLIDTLRGLKWSWKITTIHNNWIQQQLLKREKNSSPITSETDLLLLASPWTGLRGGEQPTWTIRGMNSSVELDTMAAERTIKKRQAIRVLTLMMIRDNHTMKIKDLIRFCRLMD